MAGEGWVGGGVVKGNPKLNDVEKGCDWFVGELREICSPVEYVELIRPLTLRHVTVDYRVKTQYYKPLSSVDTDYCVKGWRVVRGLLTSYMFKVPPWSLSSPLWRHRDS